MTEPATEQQKQLSFEDLEQKLVELRLQRGEQMLKSLNERKELLANNSPEKLTELVGQLAELEGTNTDGLPDVAKNAIEERVTNLKNNVNFIKNTTPETLGHNIEELQKRVTFIKVFGI